MTKKSTNRLQEQACLRLIWLCVRSIGQEGMHSVELNWCVFIHVVMSLHHSSLHVITFCGCVVTPRCLWYVIWPVAWLARFLCFDCRPVFKDLLRLLRISLQCSLSLRASCHCGPGLVVEVVCWYGAVGYRIPHPLACLLHPLPLTDWLTDWPSRLQQWGESHNSPFVHDQVFWMVESSPFLSVFSLAPLSRSCSYAWSIWQGVYLTRAVSNDNNNGPWKWYDSQGVFFLQHLDSHSGYGQIQSVRFGNSQCYLKDCYDLLNV